MTRVTLPDDLAALAGCAEVDVTEDDLGLVEFRDGARVLRCFSCHDEGRILALETEVKRQAAPWQGPKQRVKRGAKKAPVKREDDRLRAPEGAPYEDV